MGLYKPAKRGQKSNNNTFSRGQIVVTSDASQEESKVVTTIHPTEGEKRFLKKISTSEVETTIHATEGTVDSKGARQVRC